MECRYCGYEIPEGELYCGNCGKEVYAVPDYNPLDDMLSAQIKVGVSGKENADTDYLYDFSDDVKNMTSSGRRTDRMGGTTGRRYSSADTGRNTARRSTAGRNTAGRSTAGRNTTGRMISERERRRRQAELRRAELRRKRRSILLILAAIIFAIVAGCVFLYQNSYGGIVNHGYKSIERREYTEAEADFKRAMAKDSKKPDAYVGLSKSYIAQDDLEGAEAVFIAAVDMQPENAGIYEAYISFYMDTGQEMSIPSLLDDAEDSVREELADYIVPEPQFDLDDTEVFEDVQQIELSSEAESIYYTTDGTAPTTASTKYEGPIQLGEGENIIQAIAVDQRGIPSITVERDYVVEFPIENAPAVSPSTGHYDTAQIIEVKVPEGYVAYYTTNGIDPTTASTKYTGPIDMPEGETLFKAILVNSGGRLSGITTRNYTLEYSE